MGSFFASDLHTSLLRPSSGSAAKIKKALFVHWETNEGFMHQCLTNKAKSASAKSSKYTGGLATFMKTKAKLSLNRKATLEEAFKYTHTLKENKARYADQ
ncbi:hypothetical protein Ahy_A08g037541 [Arachis hypogaea]|uniref:Uncharacterized protein n=1 Tax=Arachis hypogaea TaxID=3818 RepID=A0A445BR32_ARAHY|nr:hypothetical protein Ahy_A08g037541 [Arachis hypogaea]